MSLQGNLSAERMCGLAMVSRSGFYRSFHDRQPDLEEMELRSTIQTIVVEHKLRYGYRRVTAELRHRGFLANHKRVVRLMRLDNLLSIRRSAFVTTTDSDHEFEVHLNLASRMQLSTIDQLWLADITFVRLQQEFVYLAIVLDAFSRKVVGWALDRSLAAQLAVDALNRAIANRTPAPGLVHHSDRGVQYASAEYGKVLDKHRIIASRSRCFAKLWRFSRKRWAPTTPIRRPAACPVRTETKVMYVPKRTTMPASRPPGFRADDVPRFVWPRRALPGRERTASR
jgi:putative transposase